jgi:hypothetical protein
LHLIVNFKLVFIVVINLIIYNPLANFETRQYGIRLCVCSTLAYTSYKRTDTYIARIFPGKFAFRKFKDGVLLGISVKGDI